jgi:hypothetical protein
MSDAPLVYQHRAKPYAPEAIFTLKDDRLAIVQGVRRGDFPYRDIALVRLTYRPRNTTNEGYVAKLYRGDRKTAALSNLSWKSLVDLERQDADYARFVRELIARIVAANPSVALEAGMPRLQYGVTSVVAALSMLALLIVAYQAVRHGGWPTAFLTAGLGAYFGWWSWRYLGRNRPRRFTAGALPPDVMPPAPK